MPYAPARPIAWSLALRVGIGYATRLASRTRLARARRALPKWLLQATRSRFALRMCTNLATAIFLVACGEQSSEPTKAAPQGDAEAPVATKPPELTTLINRSPMFESPEGWGPGFTKAIGRGLGVVVGPGRDNPNGLAQEFRARAGEPFKIVARASSVDAPSDKGRLQVNWTDASGKLISLYIKTINLTSEERTFEASLEPRPTK